MAKTRRRFTAEQKTSILREHLIDQVSVADLCDKHKIQPTLFYRWQKEMLENLPALLERQSGSELKALRRQAEALQAKLAQKDEVIAEIMADFIAAKKTIGGD